MKKYYAILGVALMLFTYTAWADTTYVPVTGDNEVESINDIVINETKTTETVKPATLRTLNARLARLQQAKTRADEKATAIGVMITKLEARIAAVTTAANTVVLYVPGQAQFSCVPVSGTAPLEVTCTEEATGNVKAWRWKFQGTEDPVIINAPGVIVTHTFVEPGSYAVRLTVRDVKDVDTVETKTGYITVTVAK